MVLKEQYKNINRTMFCLLGQVKESISFADSWLPRNISGNDIFYLWDILKSNTTFVDDPPGVELIQSMKTLFYNNYWGRPGAGDCDCLVTTATACCIVLNIPCRIVLAGRTWRNPVHIYNLVKDGGEWNAFDLTNDFYGEERQYPMKQIIKLR